MDIHKDSNVNYSKKRCLHCNAVLNSRKIVCKACYFKIKYSSNINELVKRECYGYVDSFWNRQNFFLRIFPYFLIFMPATLRSYIENLNLRFEELSKEIGIIKREESRALFLKFQEMTFIIKEIQKFSVCEEKLWHCLDNVSESKIYANLAQIVITNRKSKLGFIKKVLKYKVMNVISFGFLLMTTISILMITCGSLFLFRFLL